MTIAQHGKIAAAAGDNTVTLTDSGTATGNAAVESYNLAAGGNIFTTANVGQTVVGNTGIDNITGGSGNDNLSGGSGNDVLSGGLGNDVLEGGAGYDIYTGGGASDTFVFELGSVDTIFSTPQEVITDFTTDVDKIAGFAEGSLKGQVSIVNGAEMTLNGFRSAASSFFDGNDVDIFIAYNVGDLGNALMAIDHNANGTFDDGDAFVTLTGINLSSEIKVSDIIVDYWPLT